MKHSLLTLAFSVSALFTMAGQSSLRIFSEEYTPFYIYLDGVAQNNAPTLDFKIKGLNRDYYSVRISFSNSYFPQINKNYLMVVDANGRNGEVDYKLKKNRHGNPAIRFNRFTANSLYSFDNNSNNVSDGCNQAGGTNNYYSTTTVVQNGNGNVVSTSSSSFSNATNYSNGYNNSYNHYSCHRMNGSTFQHVLQAIDDEAFSDDQLLLAKRITRTNCLTSAQIKEITNVFSFDDTKLAYLKFAYEFCHDRNNYWIMNDALTFDSNKRALNKYILLF